MNFQEFVEKRKQDGDAEVHELTELQHTETGEGPWKLYIYRKSGFHTGGVWFRKGPMKYPDEEIPAAEAKRRAEEAVKDGREVRICDGGDQLVFHSENGVVIYPLEAEGFWNAVLATKE